METSNTSLSLLGEQVRGVRLSIREAEHRLNAELFLDEYPRWGIEGPH